MESRRRIVEVNNKKINSSAFNVVVNENESIEIATINTEEKIIRVFIARKIFLTGNLLILTRNEFILSEI